MSKSPGMNTVPHTLLILPQNDTGDRGERASVKQGLRRGHLGYVGTGNEVLSCVVRPGFLVLCPGLLSCVLSAVCICVYLRLCGCPSRGERVNLLAELIFTRSMGSGETTC